METLEEILVRKMVSELENPYSILFGAELPGILDAFEPSDVCDKLWRCRLENTAKMHLTMQSVRPFFCGETVRELTLTQLTDSLAHELTPEHFPCLEDLSIVDSARLTDAGILSGLSQFNSLDSLRLQKCSQLTWKSVGRIKPTRKLAIIQSLSGGNVNGQDLLAREVRTYLHLEEGYGVAMDSLVIALKEALLMNELAPALRELRIIRNTKVDDSFAAACLNAPNLRVVAFSFCAITKQGLEHLAFLQELQDLEVSYCGIQFSLVEQEERELWKAFRNLKRLEISGCNFGLEPSRTLIAINRSCPVLESFTARFGRLDQTITPQAMKEMITKRRVLDLAGNKGLRDPNFALQQYPRVTSIVRTLNLANTGMVNPVFRSAQWPVLCELTLDGCQLTERFLIALLAASPSIPTEHEGGCALPSKVSLRECKSLNDSVLRRISQHGSLRHTLEWLDLTDSSCSAREICVLRQHAQRKLVLLPGVNDAVFVEEALADLTNEDDGDEESSTTSSGYSSIQSHVLRRFVRDVEGTESTNVETSNCMEDDDNVEDDDFKRFELSQQDTDSKSELLDLCCHCPACVVAHPGSIFQKKIRYSKYELLSIRGARNAVF